MNSLVSNNSMFSYSEASLICILFCRYIERPSPPTRNTFLLPLDWLCLQQIKTWVWTNRRTVPFLACCADLSLNHFPNLITYWIKDLCKIAPVTESKRNYGNKEDEVRNLLCDKDDPSFEPLFPIMPQAIEGDVLGASFQVITKTALHLSMELQNSYIDQLRNCASIWNVIQVCLFFHSILNMLSEKLV